MGKVKAGKTYTIVSSNGTVLDSAGVKKNMHQIQQWSNVYSTNLQWKLRDAGNGYFYIENVTTGLEVNLYGNAGTKRENGTKLVSYQHIDGNVNAMWKFTPLGKKFFQITQKDTGMALDCGSDSSNGAKVQAWTANKSSATQKWKLQKLATVKCGKKFTIVSKCGNVLDSAGVKKNMHPIQQWENIYSTNLQWVLRDAGNGYHYIENVTTGLEVNLYGNPGTKRENGTKLVAYQHIDGNINAMWKFNPVDDKYFVITQKDTGMALDCCGSDQKNGTKVQAWSAQSGNKNQMWKLKKVHEVKAGKKYTIISKNGNVLDSAGVKKNMHQIQQWENIHSTNLQWKLRDAGNGYFYIENVTTGLEVNLYGNAGTTRQNGTKLVSYQHIDGNINAMWKITHVKGKWYTVTQKDTGMALDCCGSDQKNGAKVQAWTAQSGNKNQLWKFDKL